MTTPDVLVVVVTHNSGRAIDAFASAMLAELDDTHALVVVDNASTDDTVAQVRARLPAATVLEPGRNLGYGAAVNLAFATVRPRESMLVTNPDAVLHPGALRRLRDVLRPAVGIAVPRLQGLAAELGIAETVRWTGWLDPDALRAELHRATVGVSLDDDTPFNRLSTMTKIAEYLAVGLPCLAADLPENRVTAGDAARYFAPADARELASALETLLDDPVAIDAMRAAALARAPALVWDGSARRLVAAYEWLLDHGPAVPGDQHIDVAVEVAA